MVQRVIIGDDDSGIRLILKKAIEKVEGFEFVGEGADGAEALALFESLKPQIVFLDVEMPNMTGVECATKIMDMNPQTKIIFATAHEEYMPEAFKVYAFDYLVKPFKIERVYQSLNRILALEKQVVDNGISKIIKNDKALDKLLIKNKEGISFVDMKDIIIIQREDRSTVIYTKDNSYITSEGLSELEERLDPSAFFRSHKSYIINLSMITNVYPYGRWTYCIKLKNTDKDALITHDKYDELKEMFGF
jgi:two-component system LytT family response regulator